MKTKNFETSVENLSVYALSNEEMITVRGGNDGDPTVPIIVPVKI